jgi:hypothetical protein
MAHGEGAFKTSYVYHRFPVLLKAGFAKMSRNPAYSPLNGDCWNWSEPLRVRESRTGVRAELFMTSLLADEGSGK